MSLRGYMIRLTLFAVLYCLLSRLSDTVLSFLTSGERTTPIWPPAGLALAGLLLLGYRFWPAIPLGHALAFVSVLDHPPLPPLTMALVAIGNTVAALTSVYLLRRFARFDDAVERLRDVLALLTLGAFVDAALAATAGATSLWLTDVIPGPAWGSVWRVWCVGNILGVLVATPAVLAWGVRPRLGIPRRRVLEATALLLSAAAVSAMIFGAGIGEAYAIFPVLVWAALRFGLRGAATTMLVVVGIAIALTTLSHGPFATYARVSDRLVALQIFTAVVAVTVLILAATVSEREHAQAGLRRANEVLETRVIERTAQLGTAYEELRHLHEQELEYLREVDKVTGAAAAVEAGASVPEALTDVSQRPDKLGQLARVFGRMAQEVYARELRLKEQVAQLRIEIDEAKTVRQVAEITETEYFQKLRQRARQLRNPSA